MGCGGSAELKELRLEMKAIRAELETAREDQRQLQIKMTGLKSQEDMRKPSLMERRGLSQPSLAMDSPKEQLPGTIKERRTDEERISDVSTAASLESLTGLGGSQAGCISESLPIHAWYPEGESPPPRPKRRTSRCITEASPFTGRASCDMRLNIQMTKGGFKKLRFSLNASDSPDASDAPVQPIIETSQQPIRRACTESWGGDHSEAAEAGTWSNRRSRLLAKAGLELGHLSVEKLAVVTDPGSPKRHRGRCRTQPSTWDAQDLETIRKSE